MIHGKKVVVVLPAYNAERTLSQTVADLPSDVVDDVLLVDDASHDSTAALARSLGLHTFVHPTNLGYGGNQKTCYTEALRLGADVVVMVHPDYQYEPRLVTAMASMIAADVYDVVLGSRIIGKGALQGGMPGYKYVSNRVLTAFQNVVLGEKLSEYHTGYRAYSRQVLEALPLEANADDFVFDNQILAQSFYFGFRVGEVSCPTRYFPEASSINFRRSCTYGLGVIKTSLQYRAARLGLASPPIFDSAGSRLGTVQPASEVAAEATSPSLADGAASVCSAHSSSALDASGVARQPSGRSPSGAHELPVSAPHEPPAPAPISILARLLTLGGLGLAIIGELYLQFAEPTNTSKATGLIGLALGALLFGLGAVRSFEAPGLHRFPLGRLLPTGAYGRSGWAALSAAVGLLAFVTLIARLLYGSTAGSDMLLWFVASAAFGLPLLDGIRIRRPSPQTRAEIGVVAILMIVMLAVTGHDLNHWYYAAIGDEYGFFAASQAILADGVARPFVQAGVDGALPALGTLFQAAVMAIAGNNHFGWMFASALSLAIAMPAVYLVGRALVGRGVAALATAIFGFAHYVFAFSHIGAANAMALAPTSWAMAFLALSLRHRGAWLLYACGISAGLGFYTFYSARTTIPMIGLFILIQHGWKRNLSVSAWRERILEFWPLALGFVIAVTPIFAASGTTVITRMFAEVPGGYNEQITGPPVQKILFNVWLNVPAYFQNTHRALYLSGSLLDPLSALLAALGIGLAIRWWSDTSSRLVLVWTFVSVGITALLSPHTTTAVSRLLFGLPPLALLGAIAAHQVWRIISVRTAEPSRQWPAYGAVAALAVAILALNSYRFFVETPRLMHLTRESITTGALRSPLCGPDPARAIVVDRGHGLLTLTLRSYGPESTLPRFVTYDQLTPEKPLAIDGAPCVVFANPIEEPAVRAMDALRRAYPQSVLTPFTDLARIGTIMVFRPSAGAAGY